MRRERFQLVTEDELMTDINGALYNAWALRVTSPLEKRAVHISGKTRILQLFAEARRSHKAIL
jgi:hypothetical protein